jgi:rieske iron-sulfur protein
LSRRGMLCGCLVIAVEGTAGLARADDSDPARAMRPQPGDLLVFFDGNQEGAVIKAADLKPGDPPILAWAFDPKKKVPRDGSRLNQILVMRFDPAALGPTEAPRAAGGVVAYSAICTHQQCTVMDWLASKQVAQCPCHQSQYDLAHSANVVAGPAPRPLPALPLTMAGGIPTVAAPFTDRVGGMQTGT